MVIRELNIAHFGKFENHRMQFHSGMNVISGGNESGKSTIHAFIRAMLYGTGRRGGGRRLDEYRLREPWDNPGWFAGTMVVEHRGRLYRIERNFRADAASLNVIDLKAGREERDPERALAAMLGTMTETAFVNTVWLPQSGDLDTQALSGQMQEYLAGSGTEGQPGSDVERALQQLKERRRQTDTEKKEKQEALDTKIAGLNLERSWLEQEIARAQEPAQTGGRENAAQRLQIEKVDAGWQGAGRRSEARQGAIRRDAVRQDKIRRDAGRQGTDKADSASSAGGMLVLALALAAGILSAICAFVAETGALRLVLIMLAIVLLGGSMTVLAVLYDKKQRAAQKREAAVQDVHAGYAPAGNAEGLQAAGRYSDQMAAGADEMAAPEGARDLQRLLSQRAQTEQQLNELYESRDRLRAYDREMEAMDLAMMRIREAASELLEDAGRDFMLRASAIFSLLTEERYRALALDERQEIVINTPDRLLHLSQVGGSVAMAARFSLRMAGGELFGEGQLPIVLDEPFVWYDKERAAAARSWLRQCGRQVILFENDGYASQKTY